MERRFIILMVMKMMVLMIKSLRYVLVNIIESFGSAMVLSSSVA